MYRPGWRADGRLFELGRMASLFRLAVAPRGIRQYRDLIHEGVRGIVAGRPAIKSLADVSPQDVVGMWLFDEGKGEVAQDASGNGLDGRLIGGPEWVEGKFGKALRFDDQSAYVEVPPHENPTKAITVTA